VLGKERGGRRSVSAFGFGGDGCDDGFLFGDERVEHGDFDPVIALLVFAGTEEVDFVLGSPAVEEEPLFFDDGLTEFGEALGVVCGRGWEAEGGDDGWGHGGVVGFGEGDPVDGLFFDWEGSGERVCEACVAFSGEGFDGVAGILIAFTLLFKKNFILDICIIFLIY
jgi:hypothetical protein